MFGETNKTYILRLSINKIKLKVRFACTVSCALKVQGKQYEIHGQTDLKNGQASMKWSHSQTLQLKDSKTSTLSSDKKLSLLIYLKSASGKIPAGTVQLPCNSTSSTRHQLTRIDKCPDKNAFIQYDFFLQCTDEKDQTSNNGSVIQKILYPLNYGDNNVLGRAQRHFSPSRNFEPSHRMSPSRSQILRGSQYNQSIGGRQTLPIRRIGGSKNDFTKKSSLLQDYYNSQKDRGVDQERIFTLERQVQSTKTKLSIVESQLSSKAIRVVQLEKDVRQASKKVQGLELELRMSGSKIQVLQKTNKQLNGNIKKLKDQMEEDKLGYQNLIKRIQIRQQSSRQQIKTLTQKLYAAENQKQRLLFDKNITSNEFQDREKRIRDGFKDKQKKVVEQRTSLLKRIDSLQKQLQRNEEELNLTKIKNSEQMQAIHELKLLIETIQTQNQRYRVELSNTRYELTRSQNEKKILQENVQSNSKFNQQRRAYRKKLNEKQGELVQIKERLNMIEANNNRTKTSYTETQKLIKQKNDQLKLIERDYSILLKQHNIIVKEIEHKDNKIHELIEELQYQMKKSSMFETKCSELECQLQEEKQMNQIKVRESTSRQGNLEEQIERINVQLFGCNETIKTMQKQCHQLEQQLEQKTEHIQNLQSNLIQLNEVNQSYQFQKLELTQQKRIMQENVQKQLDLAQQQIKELTKDMNQMKKQHDMELRNARQLFERQQYSLEEVDGKVRERQDEMAKLNGKIIKLERQIQTKNMDIEQKDEIIGELERQKGVYMTKNRQLLKRFEDLQTVHGSLRDQYSQLQTQVQTLRKNMDKKGKQLDNIKQLYENYKSKSIQALDILSFQLSKFQSEVIIEHSDSIFCNKINNIIQKIMINNKEKLTKAQIEKIEKQAYMKKLEDVEFQKMTQIISTSKSIELLKQSTFDQHEQLNTKKSYVQILKSQIMTMEQDQKGVQQNYQSKIKNLSKSNQLKNQQINEIKEKLRQTQHNLENYENKIKDINSKVAKLQKDKKQLEQEINVLTQENKKYLDQIHEIDTKNIRLQKEKKQQENQLKRKMTQIDTNLRIEIEKVDDLERQHSTLQKQLKQEKQNVKKALRELQSKCYEYDGLQTQFLGIQQALKMKETEAKKSKTSANELKQTLETLLSSFSFRDGEVFEVSNKLEPLFAKFQVKQNMHLYEKIKRFFQQLVEVFEVNHQKVQKLQEAKNLSANLKNELEKNKIEKIKQSAELQKIKEQELAQMYQQNGHLVKKITELQVQLKSKQKEKAIMKKQFERLKIISEEQGKKMDHDQTLIKRLMVKMDEERQAIQSIKKIGQEIMKNINGLEKDKKVSIFAMATPKELLKKMEILIAQYQAKHQGVFDDCKTQWDWAFKGIKKRSSLKFNLI